MELDEHLKSKVRYHLGINSGAQIPAGDRARVEEAMALVPDELWYNEIVITLNVVISHGEQVLLFQMITLTQTVAVS